ncbi:hypothetical protein NXS19_010800 [Fusarium pseudograminearum]|nr:hypothetical protein FPSE5266_04473 [Fusarium pseudograminearum]UZP42984.1 hypothetical protein NXS19_010800 [Fusarium pseudograminearum]
MSLPTFSDFEYGDSIPDDDWEYNVPPPPPTPVPASRPKRGKGCPPPKSRRRLQREAARRLRILDEMDRLAQFGTECWYCHILGRARR